jgi:hypothetical protein
VPSSWILDSSRGVSAEWVGPAALPVSLSLLRSLHLTVSLSPSAAAPPAPSPFKRVPYLRCPFPEVSWLDARRPTGLARLNHAPVFVMRASRHVTLNGLLTQAAERAPEPQIPSGISLELPWRSTSTLRRKVEKSPQVLYLSCAHVSLFCARLPHARAHARLCAALPRSLTARGGAHARLSGGQAPGDTRLEVPSTAEVLGLLGPLPSAAGAASTPTLKADPRAALSFTSQGGAADVGDGVSLVRGRDAVSARLRGCQCFYVRKFTSHPARVRVWILALPRDWVAPSFPSRVPLQGCLRDFPSLTCPLFLPATSTPASTTPPPCSQEQRALWARGFLPRRSRSRNTRRC